MKTAKTTPVTKSVPATKVVPATKAVSKEKIVSVRNPFYQLEPIGKSKSKTRIPQFKPIIGSSDNVIDEISKLIASTDNEVLMKHARNYSTAVLENDMSYAIEELTKIIPFTNFLMQTLLQTAIDLIRISAFTTINTIFDTVDESMSIREIVLITRMMINSPKSNAYALYLEENPDDKADKLKLGILPDYYKKLELCDKKYWLYPDFVAYRVELGDTISNKTEELPEEEHLDKKWIRMLTKAK